jgi:PIN domain nuclease of toxin-antitoxin system
MKFLLDTHVLIDLADRRQGVLARKVQTAIETQSAYCYVSVASLWEITIKYRIGKLELPSPPESLPTVLASFGITVLPIVAAHALVHVEPEPRTRDPFDRLLLAKCQVEGMQLVTTDRALAAHPLAARLV